MRTLRSFVVVAAGVVVGGSVAVAGGGSSMATVGSTLASVASVRSEEMRKDMVVDGGELEVLEEKESAIGNFRPVGSSGKGCCWAEGFVSIAFLPGAGVRGRAEG